MKSSTIFLIGGIVFASEIFWQLCKTFRRVAERIDRTRRVNEKAANKSKERIAEVMFFSNESSLCRSHADMEDECPKENCPVRYLRKLTKYMDEAEKSLDVCVYVFTCQILSRAIENAHKRGVVVRIITNRHTVFNDAAQTTVLSNSGVPVKSQDPDTLMHHKFVVLDGCILISGSTNWTMTAFFGNFENLFVTNEESLVKPFVEEFEKLWNAFERPTRLDSDRNF